MWLTLKIYLPELITSPNCCNILTIFSNVLYALRDFLKLLKFRRYRWDVCSLRPPAYISTYTFSRINTNVSTSVNKESHFTRLIRDKDATSLMAIVDCRYQWWLLSFPDFHEHDSWHLFALSGNFSWYQQFPEAMAAARLWPSRSWSRTKSRMRSFSSTVHSADRTNFWLYELH